MEQIINRDLCYIMVVCVCLFIQSFIQLQSFRFKKMKEKMRLVCASLCGLFVWYFEARTFWVDNGTINHTYENSYSFSEYQETKVTFDAKKNHPRIKCLLFHVLEPVKIHLLMYRRIKSRRIVIIITNIILVFPSKRKRSDFSILFSPFFSACLPC